jgi:murein DD-endopeptidase MepM/ murein hydrolase activator NlpD
MRIKLEIDRTKASNEDETVDNQQLDRISNDANWHYAFASFFLTLAIAIPQISSWIESQYLVKSLQNLIGTTNITDLNDTRIAFPTAKSAPVTSGFGWRIHPITGERRFHTGIDFGAVMGTPIYAVDAGSIELAREKGGYGNTVIVNHGGENQRFMVTQASFTSGKDSRLYGDRWLQQ